MIHQVVQVLLEPPHLPHPIPVQLRTGYTVKQSTKHWCVKDTEQPYT